MPIIHGTLAGPHGPGPGRVRVRLQGPAVEPATERRIIGEAATTAGADGRWEMDVPATADLDPADPYVLVEERGDGTVTMLIAVPDAPGPHWTGDLAVG
jgi:hypothetical protein